MAQVNRYAAKREVLRGGLLSTSPVLSLDSLRSTAALNDGTESFPRAFGAKKNIIKQADKKLARSLLKVFCVLWFKNNLLPQPEAPEHKGLPTAVRRMPLAIAQRRRPKGE